MKVNTIDGAHLRGMFRAGASWLYQQKDAVDALNVFPVPDGDTGSNMYMTLAAAVREADKAVDSSISVVAAAAAHGALMGARGNSGVILSQFFRGLAKGLEGVDEAGAADVARALSESAATAFKAVMRPVEGTILTVGREAARGAAVAARATESVLEVLSACLDEGNRALSRTPEMLPALRDAGVVDAGGQGLLVAIEGAVRYLRGKQADTGLDVPATAVEAPPAPGTAQAAAQPARAGISETHAIEFQYCTEFLIKGHGLSPDSVRGNLEGAGDSLLSVGTDQLVKVHIHTNHPGRVLEYAVQLGELSEVQIHNMAEQNVAAAAKALDDSLATHSGGYAYSDEPKQEKLLGVVAVSVGDGLASIFRSLGADVVVAGGQTMNPSIEEIKQAVESTGAGSVVVLPNNSNVVLTAQQVVQLTDVIVSVVPTRTIPQGVAAMLSLSPDDTDAASVALAMKEAAGAVSTGEVTYAVRSSRFGGLEIREGDFIGLQEGDIVLAGSELETVASSLVERMVVGEVSIVTVYYGASVDDATADAFGETLRERFPSVEVEVQRGGQPLYFYIISAE